MINGSWHVEIDGVKYEASQVQETPISREQGTPLRPPNAQIVQGDDGKFNLRPDVLRWEITDWSGGSGGRIFDAKDPTRFWRGEGINGYEKPGVLLPGPAVRTVHESDDTTLFELGGNRHVLAKDVLFTSSGAAISAWEYDDSDYHFETAVTVTGSSGGLSAAVWAGGWFYVLDNNSIIRMNEDMDSFTDWVTGLSPDGNHFLAVAGQALFYIDQQWIDEDDSGTKVYEVPTQGTAPVSLIQIVDIPEVRGNLDNRKWADAGNRLYLLGFDDLDTAVIEVIPSSAAGTGFGGKIAKLPGRPFCVTFGAGLLYLALGNKKKGGNFPDPGYTIYYLNPSDGTYGILGLLRPDGIVTSANFNVGTSDMHAEGPYGFYVAANTADVDTGTPTVEVYWIEYSNGSIHPCASLPIDPTDAPNVETVVRVEDPFEAGAVVTMHNLSGMNEGSVFFLDERAFEGENYSPYMISPRWHFGLLDFKILSSIRLTTEEDVPTNWRVYVDYRLDADSVWSNAGFLAAGSDHSTFEVSTAGNTQQFSWLQIRVRFEWLGTGVPETAPAVSGIDVWAQVTEKLRSWTLQLSLEDDHSPVGGQKFTGQQKGDNIRTLGQSGNVVLFKDGTVSSLPNEFDSYSVLVDEYTINYERPGEGTATVRLLERA